MRYISKSFFTLILVISLIFAVFCSCSATSEKNGADENVLKISSEILAVSYRGDTASFPENSLEGVISAYQKGADAVSVSIMKTDDGIFVLCENESLNNICDAEYMSLSQVDYETIKEYSLYDNNGEITECKFATVEEVIDGTDEELFLIFDFDWQEKDSLYDIVESKNALGRVFFRTKESARVISDWVSTKQTKPNVIGIYDGGIIFNAISHINTLSKVGMSFVQYQSKNYFNVMYGSLVYRNFNSEGKAAAIAPCYDPDLCGLRTDSQLGWDSLINRGFTAIETVNIESLAVYIQNRKEATEILTELLNKAEKTNTEKYSFVSIENLQKAINDAKLVLERGTVSLDKIQSASSTLVLAMNKLMVKTGDDTQQGALNITAGKVVAAVFVTAGILCGEIFVHKMHVKGRKKN